VAAAGQTPSKKYAVGSAGVQEIPQSALPTRHSHGNPHLSRRTGCLFGRDT